MSKISIRTRIKEILTDTSLISADLLKNVLNSISLIQKALDTYSVEEIAFSFNGGKDCLVLLALYDYAFGLLNIERRIESIYVRPKNSFEEVVDFVKICENEFSLNLTIQEGDLLESFKAYLNCHQKIKAVLIGIRSTDPYARDLKYFLETDHGWPNFMRIHPILDWSYNQIWEFIRAVDLSYCVLYDQGFTSLGSTHNTIPNPLLKTSDGSYAPAYHLMDQDKERLGRL